MTPDRRRARQFSALLAIVFVVGTAAAALGIPGQATRVRQTSGDEPHYLVTAMSLATDRDLDVSDEFERGAYRDFHAPALRPQGAVRDDGTVVEPHDALLPALLAVPVRLGGWFAAKAVLALLAGGTAAAAAWVMVRRFTVRPVTAAATAGLLAASAPLAVYGHQVYPEIPAALLTTVAVAVLTGHLRPRDLVVLGLAVVALPWLSVKYVPVAAALAGLAAARLLRARRHGSAIALVTALAGAGVAYVVLHLIWYGGPTVYAAGRFFQQHGGEVSVAGVSPNYAGRSVRLIGLLIDRYFGLASWQPAWLLVVPACVAMARRRPPGWRALAAPIALGWLGAAFVAATMHGWWFAGRQVVVIAPLLAITIGVWADRGAARRTALVVLGVIGVATYAFLAVETWTGASNWIVDFTTTGAPWHRAWRFALPDYRDLGAAAWALHAAWLAGLVGWGLFAWSSARRVDDQAGTGPGAAASTGPADVTASVSR